MIAGLQSFVCYKRFNDDWWSIKANLQVWLDHEAEVNSVIITEIITMYAEHRALAGWYIPYEFYPFK